MCVTDFDISVNSIYHQQELHVLVTASLFINLTITYKYQSPISNNNNVCCVWFYFVTLDVSLGFNFLLCVCYVNPAYGFLIEIICMYVSSSCSSSASVQELIALISHALRTGGPDGKEMSLVDGGIVQVTRIDRVEMEADSSSWLTQRQWHCVARGLMPVFKGWAYRHERIGWVIFDQIPLTMSDTTKYKRHSWDGA